MRCLSEHQAKFLNDQQQNRVLYVVQLPGQLKMWPSNFHHSSWTLLDKGSWCCEYKVLLWNLLRFNVYSWSRVDVYGGIYPVSPLNTSTAPILPHWTYYVMCELSFTNFGVLKTSREYFLGKGIIIGSLCYWLHPV